MSNELIVAVTTLLCAIIGGGPAIVVLFRREIKKLEAANAKTAEANALTAEASAEEKRAEAAAAWDDVWEDRVKSLKEELTTLKHEVDGIRSELRATTRELASSKWHLDLALSYIQRLLLILDAELTQDQKDRLNFKPVQELQDILDANTTKLGA